MQDRHPPEAVHVGALASLTGQFRSQGSQALEGIAAWVRDTNASGGIFISTLNRRLPVRLTYYNDESAAGVARALTEKLIADDRVDLLLGPYSSVLTLAAAPVAERFEKVLWNHGGAADRIYSRGFRYVVGILTPASQYLPGVIDLVKNRDPEAQRIAFLRSSRGSFPADVASGVESYAATRGFRTVFSGQYTPPIADFSPLLKQIAASEADIIVGVGRIQDDLLLARQLVQTQVSAKAIAIVAAGIEQFKDELGSGADGFMGPSQWEAGAVYAPDYGPSAHDLAERHRLFNPGSGDYPLFQAYAAGLVARRCVEEAGTLDNRSLREVASRLDFTTFYGRFKLDPQTGCQIGRSVVIVQWQGGEKIVVWPERMRRAEMNYPSHLKNQHAIPE